MHDFEVVSNQEIADGIFSLVISAPKLASALKPGQFVNIAVPGDASSLLRVPLSFYRADAQAGTVELWYAVVGDDTRRLSQMGPGSTSNLLGPGGRGWFVPEGTRKALLVAGGNIGAADVDLVAGSPGAQLDIHLERAHKLVNGVAGDLTNDLAAILGKLFEPRAGLTGKGGHTGVLKAHGVDHTAGDLGHAGRGVAGPGLGSTTLGGDGAQLGDIKEVLELPTVAKGTGCGVDGVLHLDAAEIDGHVHGTH